MTKKAIKAHTFKEAVQQSLVKQPTQVGFSRSQWEDSFRSYASGEKDDRRVYEAGLWFADQLDAVRQALKEFPDAPCERSQLWRFYVAAVNREYAVIGNAIVEDYSSKAGSYITSGAMIEKRLPIGPGGYPVDLRGTLESLVSAIRYPLAESSKSKVIKEGLECSDIKILGDITNRIIIAIFYDNLSDFWAECLWNGWSVSERDDTDLIFPPQSQEFFSKVLSQHRSDTLLLELTWRSITQWKEMPEDLRNLEVSRPRITKIKRHKKRAEFSLGRQKNRDFPSVTFLAAIAAEELYWNELLLERLPKAPDLNIREMLSIWYVLASLGEVLKSNFPEDTGVTNLRKLIEFAPILQLTSLKYAIRKATGLHHTKVEAAINFFVFTGTTRQDPWFKPIVPLSDKECTVIVPALTVPNLIKSIESWMKEGGLDLGDRGAAFEEYIRTRLRESIAESKLLSKTKASNRSLKVSDGLITEQIDLMWLVGSVLIIGEVKCAIYPANPIERYNYIEILRGAAQQATRKAQFVRSNIKNSLSSLGIEDSDQLETITVFPLVITNLHLGVGCTIDNVPVSDIYILERYLEGSQKFFVETSADGEGEAIHTELFYSSKQEAETNLTSYLLNPPLFRILARLVDFEIIQLLPMNENEKKKAYARFYVREPSIEN